MDAPSQEIFTLDSVVMMEDRSRDMEELDASAVVAPGESSKGGVRKKSYPSGLPTKQRPNSLFRIKERQGKDNRGFVVFEEEEHRSTSLEDPPSTGKKKPPSQLLRTSSAEIKFAPSDSQKPPSRTSGGGRGLKNLARRLSVSIGLDKLDECEPGLDMASPGLSLHTVLDLIKTDDLERLKAYLDSRTVSLEARDKDGNTPLLYAAARGKSAVVSLLLSHGADTAAEDDDKCTALHVSAREGHADVVRELLDHIGGGTNASNSTTTRDAPDAGGWSPLVWACYKGRLEAAAMLLGSGADPNAKGVNNVSGLIWAAGRGHEDVVRLLLEKGAKVDASDKYGTTALIWACRRGHDGIVARLLRAGANVDASGMYSWTPLLVAARGAHADVLEQLLEKSPNMNATDMDGLSALAAACKEGHDTVARQLLAAGAHVNVQDRAGDTCLIYAAKGGHREIVEALLKKYADVDVRGKEGRTCLHWAVDKGHLAVVRLLLAADPDLEVRTKDGGDTALLRSVKMRHVDIAALLVERRAKVSASDARGDTPLHVAMRARSKALVEILLRNPKHSQLLYKPNRQGETPYSIDVGSQRTILGQVFGARRLNANEDSENILGYDLYSSALSDMLTEPSLSMPIAVGLYAKWGSGKSFLLRKLKQEMTSFTREWIDPTFHMSPLLFFVLLHIAAVIGLICWSVTYTSSNYQSSTTTAAAVGIAIPASILVFSYLILICISKASLRYDWTSLGNLSVFIARRFSSLKLVLDVLFRHPPGQDHSANINQVLPLRLLYTDQTKVITSSGGQNSVTQMVGSLLDSVEDQYGKIATGLFRALRPSAENSTASKRWRKICCVPTIIVYLACFAGVIASTVLTVLHFHRYKRDIPADDGGVPDTGGVANFSLYDEGDANSFVAERESDILVGLLIALSSVVAAVLFANLYTLANCVQALAFSQRRHLQRAVAKHDLVKSEGYLQAVKSEVLLMLDMLKCLDAFAGQQSRLVVVVDGLDSCEQPKVLSVLDAVTMLFSDPGAPFVILLAIDPHVITKAIELNLNQAFSDTSIGGNAYLRNLVHLPFFLQNSGLRKVKIAQQTASAHRLGSNAFAVPGTMSSWLEMDEGGGSVAESRKMSADLTGFPVGSNLSQKRFGASKKRGRSRLSDSISSSIGSNLNKSSAMQGPQDLTKVLLTDDYFSDVNPRSMRRLMNVIYVMGRLLKAFHIDFNWYHLASWVNLTEQWPYRMSWIILYAELNEDSLEEMTGLKSIYDRVKSAIPTQKEVEPLLEMDRDEKKLETVLNYHKKTMTLVDLKIFLPFSVNLDPYVKKVIKEEIQSLQEIGMPLEQILNTSSSNNRGVANASTANLAAQAPAAAAAAAAPPLTRRQAVGLSKRLSQSDFGKSQNPSSAALIPQFQQQMMAYGYFPPPPPGAPMWNPYPALPPHAHSFLQTPTSRATATSARAHQFGPAESPVVRKTSEDLQSPLHLPPELMETPLSEKSVNEICDMIKLVGGLSPSKQQNYCGAVVANNISGTVLAHCDLAELKAVLGMTFGDWEIFRLALKQLRSSDQSHKSDFGRTVTFSIGQEDQRVQTSSASRGPTPPRPAESKPFTPPSSSHPTALEKQITLEDAMISGLLSTLNEEAQEDILTEERASMVEKQGVAHSHSTESGVVYIAHSVAGSVSADAGRVEQVMNTDAESGRTSSNASWYASEPPSTSISWSKTASTEGLGSVSTGVAISTLVSVPKSPTATTRVHSTTRTSPFRQATASSQVRNCRGAAESGGGQGLKKARYMRDRLDSLPGSDGGGAKEDDPYAWLSQTAPASPNLQRPKTRNEKSPLVATTSNASEYSSNSIVFSIDAGSKESWFDTSTTSMERLSGKVKKKLKHVLNSMDSGTMPVVQRPKPVGAPCVTTPPSSSVEEEKSPLVSTTSSVTGSPSKQSDFLTPQDNSSLSPCSSPEQETVTRRPSQHSRGPHVQELFGTHLESSTADNDINEPDAAGDVITAVLPDGKVITKEKEG